MVIFILDVVVPVAFIEGGAEALEAAASGAEAAEDPETPELGEDVGLSEDVRLREDVRLSEDCDWESSTIFIRHLCL